MRKLRFCLSFPSPRSTLSPYYPSKAYLFWVWNQVICGLQKIDNKSLMKSFKLVRSWRAWVAEKRGTMGKPPFLHIFVGISAGRPVPVIHNGAREGIAPGTRPSNKKMLCKTASPTSYLIPVVLRFVFFSRRPRRDPVFAVCFLSYLSKMISQNLLLVWTVAHILLFSVDMGLVWMWQFLRDSTIYPMTSYS